MRGGAAGGVSAGRAVFRVSARADVEAKTLRLAVAPDIDALIRIRGAVRENRLSDPSSVTRSDYDWFVEGRRVWLGEVGGQIAGFSAGDPRDGTIWALFVDPAFEGLGLGVELLAKACADLKADGYSRITLFTDPGTKASRLYQRLGWQEQGISAEGEMGFTLDL